MIDTSHLPNVNDNLIQKQFNEVTNKILNAMAYEYNKTHISGNLYKEVVGALQDKGYIVSAGNAFTWIEWE